MTNMLGNRSGRAWAGLLALYLGLARVASGQTVVHGPYLEDASLTGTLAAYQADTQYGPESRALQVENWDLTHPFLTESPSLPLISSAALRELESQRDSGLSEQEILSKLKRPSSLATYQFVMNRTILTGTRDELNARLTVTSVSSSNGVPRVHVVKAEVIGDSYFGSPNLGTVPFSCETNSPACTFRWRAPAEQRQYWGALELQVTLTLEGSADEFVARQGFYSSPMVAGRFTGDFHERIQNGSLLIDAGVSVQKRMLCSVSANLYSIDKQAPTHHVTRRLIVDPSMKTITFTFFGKIFRDYGNEGAFRLQDLKAQCDNLAYPPEWAMDIGAHQAQLQEFQSRPPTTREPIYVYFRYNDFTYTTRAYANSVFSDAEWQSPERTQRIGYLEKAAMRLADPGLDVLKQEARVRNLPPAD